MITEAEKVPDRKAAIEIGDRRYDSPLLSQVKESSRGLTRREAEVALLINAGMSNKQIARRLALSVGTVKLYVHTILQKAGVRSRYDLAARNGKTL